MHVVTTLSGIVRYARVEEEQRDVLQDHHHREVLVVRLPDLERERREEEDREHDEQARDRVGDELSEEVAVDEPDSEHGRSAAFWLAASDGAAWERGLAAGSRAARGRAGGCYGLSPSPSSPSGFSSPAEKFWHQVWPAFPTPSSFHPAASRLRWWPGRVAPALVRARGTAGLRDVLARAERPHARQRGCGRPASSCRGPATCARRTRAASCPRNGRARPR